jgi:hypothetical protein
VKRRRGLTILQQYSYLVQKELVAVTMLQLARLLVQQVIRLQKGGLKSGFSTGSTGTVVAKAITDFSSVLSSMFNQWQERNQFQNVDPSLRKKYEELLIKQKNLI